ncbi:hypothetical protein Tco_0304278 [Tanacetum coccineum]
MNIECHKNKSTDWLQVMSGEGIDFDETLAPVGMWIRYHYCSQVIDFVTRLETDEKEFEMSMMGELTYFIGLQIKKDDKIPMVPPNNLGPDLASKPVNETLYRGMISPSVEEQAFVFGGTRPCKEIRA